MTAAMTVAMTDERAGRSNISGGGGGGGGGGGSGGGGYVRLDQSSARL